MFLCCANIPILIKTKDITIMLHFESVFNVKEKSRKLYIKTPSGVFSGLDIRFDNELGTYIAAPNQETMTVADLQAKLTTLNAPKTINGECPYFLLDECIGTNLSTYLFTEPLTEKRFGVGSEYLVIATDVDLYNKVIKRRKFYTARHLNTTLSHLEATIFGTDDDEMRSKVDLNPVFQRGHVWTREQQISYIENFLRAPQSVNKTIYMNDLFIYGSVDKVTDDNNMVADKIVCLDGLQRLTAALDFVHGKFTIFNGVSYDDILNSPDRTRILNDCVFDINYLVLSNNKEVIDFYVDFNAGGTPHTKEEIERVKKLIA